MSTNNVEFLVDLIRTKRPLLFAGAGASARGGYPIWGPFLEGLAAQFAPGIDDFRQPLEVADQIANEARAAGHEDQYLKVLFETFCPKRGVDLRFHRNLVSLGFSGLATTNYDVMLEQACDVQFRQQLDNTRCDPIDLRDFDRRFSTGQFLLALNTDDSRRSVLHIHGVYTAARKMVLGARSYKAAYGHDLPDVDRELETFHRKTLYALLSRPVLFVGFNHTDPFIDAMLGVLERDFVLTNEADHCAILSYDISQVDGATPEEINAAHEEAQEAIRKRLRGWIVPVCYHAPSRDHSALDALLEDVAAALGTVPRAASDVEGWAAKTIQEL